MTIRTLTFKPWYRSLAALLLASLILSLVAPPAWAQGTQTQVVGRHRAFVLTVRGTVEVRAAGQTNWTAARANTEIRTGDRLRTGPNSSARLKVGDVGEFDVQASSELTVGNLQQVRTTARAFFLFQRQVTRDDVAVDLRSGDLRSNFQRQPGRVGNYNVHTPVAVAGVRGTTFELDLEGDRPWYERMDGQRGDGGEMGLRLTVSEGVVGMVGPNWERTVNGGQQLNMVQGRVPGQPEQADPEKLKEISGSFTDTGTGDTSSVPGAGSSSSSSSDTVAAVRARALALFAAYRAQDKDAFTGLVGSSFKGIDQDGTPIDKSALEVLLADDFEMLGRVQFNGTVQSITPVEAGGFSVAATWSGAFRFENVPDTEIVLAGQAATLLFDDANRLVGWQGQSPFGFEEPEATGAGSTDYFDTNVVLVEQTAKLFQAYANEDENGFLSLVAPAFAGVNNSGNALTYATLPTSLQFDFATLVPVDGPNVNINSIVKQSDGTYAVRVTWSGKYLFVSEARERSFTGMSMLIVWGGDRPFSVQSWEGASAFGLSNPSTAVAQTPREDEDDTSAEISYSYAPPEEDTLIYEPAPAPVVAASSGYLTSRIITGRSQQFAPYRVTITGQNFVEGSRVQFYDDELGIWEDSENNEFGLSAIPYFQSSSQMFLDFVDDEYQYLPDDPLTEVHYWRVINPDGQTSDPQLVTATITPGPLELTAVSTSRSITDYLDPSPVIFEFEGYNFVMPLQVAIEPSVRGGIAAGAALVNTLFNILSGPSVMQSQDGSPVRFQFEAQQLTSLYPQDHYVNVTDARGQMAGFAFPVTAAPPPSSISWTTNQTLTSDFIVTSGQTLTIGSGVTVSTSNGSRIVVDGTLDATGATFQQVKIEVMPTGNATLSTIAIDGTGLNGPTIVNNGGTLQVNGGTIGNSASTGVGMSSGTTTLYNVSFSNNNVAVGVQGGTLNLEGPTITGGQTGVVIAGGSVNASSGGSISGTANEGIIVDGGALTISGSPFSVSNAGSNNIRVGGAATVSLSSVTLSGATTGLMIASAASGADVQLTGVTVSGSSGPGVLAQAGTLQVLGGCNLGSGTSAPALQIEGSAAVSTSGSGNSFTGTAGAPAVVHYATGASGNVQLGSGTSVSGASRGIEIFGNGSFQVGSGVTVSGAQMAGILVDNGSASVQIGAATIQNNGGDGVLVGNCTVVDIQGADILNNALFGVARTSPSILPGYVSLLSVQLAGNNGQGGSDLNTSPAVSNSTQYNYLINPPNSVTSPR